MVEHKNQADPNALQSFNITCSLSFLLRQLLFAFSTNNDYAGNYHNELHLTEKVIRLILAIAGIFILVFEMTLIFQTGRLAARTLLYQFRKHDAGMSFLLLNLLPVGYGLRRIVCYWLLSARFFFVYE